MDHHQIIIKGAAEHNLRGFDLRLPREKLIVFTGISGSGKSSLAFDTIFAEGQRRYVESLSVRARAFLETLKRPAVESIEGLSPTIAIEQRLFMPTPRSTLATSTELADFLRLLFAKVGTPFDPATNEEIRRETPDSIMDRLQQLPEVAKLMIMAPVLRQRAESGMQNSAYGMQGAESGIEAVLQNLMREGFMRVRVDGDVTSLDVNLKPDPGKPHDVDIVIDRLYLRDENRSRIAESVELALQYAGGTVIVAVFDEDTGEYRDHLFSEHFVNPKTNFTVPKLAPKLFNSASPHGACDACHGLGIVPEFDPDLVIADKDAGLREILAGVFERKGSVEALVDAAISKFCRIAGVRDDARFSSLTKEQQEAFLYGLEGDADESSFIGLLPALSHGFDNAKSVAVKKHIEEYKRFGSCPACEGSGLRSGALAVRIAGLNIHEVMRMTIENALAFFKSLTLSAEKEIIGRSVIDGISARLGFLADVGLSYLTLDRKSITLSGGEAQRIRLATQVNSSLVGVCYVLDEPTVGLHQRDTEQLLRVLKEIRDLGNTVIVVEHDFEVLKAADHVVDIGPGAGAKGGQVVFEGSVEELRGCEESITAKFLTGAESIHVPEQRRTMSEHKTITVKGARGNNLKNIDAKFPVGCFTAVTGVSGSGKSTLVIDTLLPALKRRLSKDRLPAGEEAPAEYDQLLGTGQVDKIVLIDQAPIGRSPRSNPATHTGAFDEIRKLFAKTKEAKIRGYKHSRFSFNTKGGRCEACQGQGIKRVEMHFLPDVFVECESCKGTRYSKETLHVRYRGKTIADVLNMSVEEAVTFFGRVPALRSVLDTLSDVGLGYMSIGQSSTTLSGGEAQRVKLATELACKQSGRTVYILDEPTTGLHPHDIERILGVLHALVDLGNTVIVIEHSLDVIKTADWVIDLGPGAGEQGGRILFAGRPEELCAKDDSYTGKYLASHLQSVQMTA
ncbi:MAG: excinuclease ABC subunit UvrA [Planctomycetes bacterium]|nr:excinuclease ABC subunit UvrA [Planctomycetota bacterium]